MTPLKFGQGWGLYRQSLLIFDFSRLFSRREGPGVVRQITSVPKGRTEDPVDQGDGQMGCVFYPCRPSRQPRPMQSVLLQGSPMGKRPALSKGPSVVANGR